MARSHRDNKGRFTRGNQAARGSRGGRRYSNVAKRAVDEVLNAPEVEELHDDGRPTGRRISLVEKARQTIDRALEGIDKDGNVSYAALMAARDVLNRAYGQPKATMDLNVSNTDQLLGDITQAEQATELEDLNHAHIASRNGRATDATGNRERD